MNFLNKCVTQPLIDWRDLHCVITGNVEPAEEKEKFLFTETSREELDAPLYKRVSFVIPAIMLGVANLIEGAVRKIIGTILFPLSCFECSEEFWNREFNMVATDELDLGGLLVGNSMIQLAFPYFCHEEGVNRYIDAATDQALDVGPFFIPLSEAESEQEDPSVEENVNGEYFESIGISHDTLACWRSSIREKDLATLALHQVTSEEMETIFKAVDLIYTVVQMRMVAGGKNMARDAKKAEEIIYLVIDDYMQRVIEALENSSQEEILGIVACSQEHVTDDPSQNRVATAEINIYDVGIMPLSTYNYALDTYIELSTALSDKGLTLFTRGTWGEDEVKHYLELRKTLSSEDAERFHQAIALKIEEQLEEDECGASEISAIIDQAYAEIETSLPRIEDEEEVVDPLSK
ncbi:MAG: hypothetical protein HY860_03510 [Chlamydiales bacterium]|nr:hypothetical protein [Chlamydiales bacterium]